MLNTRKTSIVVSNQDHWERSQEVAISSDVPFEAAWLWVLGTDGDTVLVRAIVGRADVMFPLGEQQAGPRSSGRIPQELPLRYFTEHPQPIPFDFKFGPATLGRLVINGRWDTIVLSGNAVVEL